jgi:hypothetical protein
MLEKYGLQRVQVIKVYKDQEEEDRLTAKGHNHPQTDWSWLSPSPPPLH